MLLNQIIDPLNKPLNNKNNIPHTKTHPIKHITPNIITHKSINTPIQTKIKTINTLIPINHNQHKLIINNHQTNKTTITINTIINQKNNNLIYIYITIKQKLSTITQTITTLKKYNTIKHTIIIVTNTKNPTPLQYLTPYNNITINKKIIKIKIKINNKTIKNTLYIYNNLSKHT